MSDDSKSKKYKYKFKRGRVGDGGIGWFMFVAYIGAAVYFVSQAKDFWGGVLGLLKAIVWPAFLIFQALKGLNV